jgi:Zinc-binding dehydrogenase
LRGYAHRGRNLTRKKGASIGQAVARAGADRGDSRRGCRGPEGFTDLQATAEGREHPGEILREATRLREAGYVVPLVDPRRFTLETVGDAYRAIRERTARGKLLVDIAAT